LADPPVPATFAEGDASILTRRITTLAICMQRTARSTLARTAGHAICTLATCTAGACLLALAGCSTAPAAESASDVEALPEFTPTEATLFDDTISLAVFEEEVADAPSLDTLKLRERVARADSVLPVRISTVTRDTSGDSQTYQLSVTPAGQPLVGAPQPEPLVVSISSRSPSFPFVRSSDTALVGRRLILFFRRYEVDGQPTMHWRLEPDAKHVREAVVRAAGSRESES
jgi:hypothetical protein